MSPSTLWLGSKCAVSSFQEPAAGMMVSPSEVNQVKFSVIIMSSAKGQTCLIILMLSNAERRRLNRCAVKRRVLFLRGGTSRPNNRASARQRAPELVGCWLAAGVGEATAITKRLRSNQPIYRFPIATSMITLTSPLR
jgi:hypothetical protein